MAVAQHRTLDFIMVFHFISLDLCIEKVKVEQSDVDEVEILTPCKKTR